MENSKGLIGRYLPIFFHIGFNIIHGAVQARGDIVYSGICQSQIAMPNSANNRLDLHPPTGFARFLTYVKIDELAKRRHSGECRSPGALQLFENTGFRLSPE
jgi:hypothetical protein